MRVRLRLRLRLRVRASANGLGTCYLVEEGEAMALWHYGTMGLWDYCNTVGVEDARLVAVHLDGLLEVGRLAAAAVVLPRLEVEEAAVLG